MTCATPRWFTGFAVVLALWPAIAEAQTVARSFQELIAVVKADETVIVTDTSGRRIRGALLGVDEDSLSLAIDGRAQRFARSEVGKVQTADDLVNGVLIGAAAGLGAALGLLTIIGSGDGYVLPSAKAGAPLLLSGAGALVGILVDRGHEGGRVLYLSPVQTSDLIVSPLLARDRQGVVLSLRF